MIRSTKEPPKTTKHWTKSKWKHQMNSPRSSQTMFRLHSKDISLLAVSDSRHCCNFSINLSGPLVSIDNKQKTMREGSVVLFSVFFESVISIKKWINCWLIQHTSQLQIKRASWGLQSPKDGRCHAHIQAYFICLWNIELVCGDVVPLGVCVVGAVCKSGCDTPVCNRRLISGTCWEILRGKWCNLKLRCSRQVASHILLTTAEQCLCNFGGKFMWMQALWWDMHWCE